MIRLPKEKANKIDKLVLQRALSSISESTSIYDLEEKPCNANYYEKYLRISDFIEYLAKEIANNSNNL
jgi:hypothetical protein